MISEAILITKIYARLQEIASNFFQNFLGEAPQNPRGARFGASPPYRPPPISKILESVPVYCRPYVIHRHKSCREAYSHCSGTFRGNNVCPARHGATTPLLAMNGPYVIAQYGLS